MGRQLNAIFWSLLAFTIALFALGGIPTLYLLYPQNELDVFSTETSVNICHISDFHAAVERRGDRGYANCSQAQFPLSKVVLTKHLLDQHDCQQRVFVGDLMHGGDYDFLESSHPLHPSDSSIDNISSRLLPFWKINVWTYGNHEFGADGEEGISRIIATNDYDESKISLVSSNIAIVANPIDTMPKLDNKTSFYKPVDNTTAAALLMKYHRNWVSVTILPEFSICYYAVIRPDLVDVFPDANYFKILSPSIGFWGAYNQSLDHGCDKSARILLSHMGYKEDLSFLNTLLDNSPVRIGSCGQPYCGGPPIHALLGGHSHSITESYPMWYRGVAISHVGSYGGWVGKLILKRSPRLTWPPWRGERFVDPWRVHRIGKRYSTRYVVENDANSYNIGPLEAEHGIFVEDSVNKSLSERLAVLTKSTMNSLCETDDELLGTYREELMRVIKTLTHHIVADFDETITEDVTQCRRGDCYFARWVSKGVKNVILAVASEDLICGAPSYTSESPKNTSLLLPFTTLLAFVGGGILRGSIPAKCESIFDRRVGDCNKFNFYNLERMLPYHNRLRIAFLESPNALCRILVRSIVDWESKSCSHPGLLHSDGLHYFVHQSPCSNGFTNLWKINSGEKVGLEIETVAGTVVRATCSKRMEFNCAGGTNCTAALGRIAVVLPDLIAVGADGGFFSWHDDADVELMRRSSFHVNRHETTCWYRGIEDLTLNDAAALFFDKTSP